MIPILISAISFSDQEGGTAPLFPSIAGTMRHQLLLLKWGNKNMETKQEIADKRKEKSG